jgi:hypothetical protein
VVTFQKHYLGGEGPFTLCLNDVRPSTATTVGWRFTESAFTIKIRK